jgi:hypothetical protein
VVTDTVSVTVEVVAVLIALMSLSGQWLTIARVRSVIEISTSNVFGIV